MKDEKQKKLTFKVIDKKDPIAGLIQEMIKGIIKAHHKDLAQVRIATVWHLSRKPDKDGKTELVSVRVFDNLERELMPYDVAFILVKEFWENSDVTDALREALLDHALSQVTPVLDKDGEPVEDERDRKQYRKVSPGIQAFPSVVRRHGLYNKALQTMARAIQASKQLGLPLLDESDEPETTAELTGPHAVN